MSGYSGLSSIEVEESRNKFGANVLPPAEHTPAWKVFIGKFKDPLILILIVAALISAATGGEAESIGIIFAVVLSCGIGFINEYRAGRAFDVLNQSDDAVMFKVIRNSNFTEVPRSELVTGDLIFVERGEEIPADAIVIESVDLHVDQSKFTGEPEPILKLTDSAPGFGDFAESSYPANLLLRGSTVSDGSGYAKITAVGGNTEIGRTAAASSEITNAVTPLQKQLNKLGKVIAVAGISAATALLVILLITALREGRLSTNLLEWFTGGNLPLLLGIFMVAVTLIVVAVPEGLPMSVTLSLACSMRKMASANCLVRHLHACETIGAATVICTDKTGTLTMNKMEVAAIDFPDKEFLPEALCVNSTAQLNGSEVIGNPTEGALLRYAASNDIDYRALRDNFKTLRQWPFTAQLKFMATLGRNNVLHIKGAPEIVLEKCDKIMENGKVSILDPVRRATLEDTFGSEQAKGRRTLGFAMKTEVGNSGDISDLCMNSTYLGFVSIADPVRPEVKAAVQACRKAGIDIKIVTGDTPATAAEIGRQIELWGQGESGAPVIIEGRDFASLSPLETLQSVKKINLIARARPDDKLKLVRALQQNGEVVAVTGDGTNDAPALHYADVGVAMGKCGTAIAREASDIILLDDSFSSIVNGVLWGRSLYLNIQRFMVFQLTINLAAVGIALTGPFIGMSIPLTVIQMLWINLIMDTFAALALASEPPTPAVMSLPPRAPGAFIVTRQMGTQIITTAIFFLFLFFGAGYMFSEGGVSGRDLTLIFTGFVLVQFWNLFNVRVLGAGKTAFSSLGKNPVFCLVALGILVGQVIITQFGGTIFRTVPLSLVEWLVVFFGTSIVLIAGELLRMFRRRSNK